MLVDDMDYVYDDMELSIDCLDPYLRDEFSPWDKFNVDVEDAFGGSTIEDLNFDFHESKCLTQDLMWSSGSEDLDDPSKILKRLDAEKLPATPKPSPSPPAMVNNPHNQRSLLIKSQPQYQAESSVSLSPPISDDECAFPDPESEPEVKTETMKYLEEHITTSVLNAVLDSDILAYFSAPSDTPLPLASCLVPPPPRPSFVIDHCYSKEVEPEDDGPYESNLGIDTPSETESSGSSPRADSTCDRSIGDLNSELFHRNSSVDHANSSWVSYIKTEDDEDEFERADASFVFKQENLQDDDDEEEEEEEEEEEVEQKESITRMIKMENDDDDEEEEIDVVSVSDHPNDIKLSPSSSSYLYPKTKRNVYGSFGTIPKKTLPIPERKCVNGKYILMDMEVPTPVKRNAGRTATKPAPKKRRASSSDDEEDDDDDDDSDSESSYKRSYSRYGSRKQRSPAKKRRVSVEMESGCDKRNLHNSLERMRRIGLKNLFDSLRNAIPSISQRERTAKVVILNTATAMVGQVKRQEDKYTSEKVALKRKQEMLRKRLSELRKLAARNR